MGWEQYISEETLHTASLLELQQIREDLQRDLEKRKQRFAEYREWVSSEFVHVFVWHKAHYQRTGNAARIEIQMKDDVDSADSFYQVGQAVEKNITELKDAPELQAMLESKRRHMCIKGFLPRNYAKQIRPEIVLLAQQCYLNFLEEKDGAVFKITVEQMEVFEDLITALVRSVDEERAKKGIQTAIDRADTLLKTKGNHLLAVLDDSWDYMLKSLISLRQRLHLDGYTRKSTLFTDDIQLLEQAILNLDAQIMLKQIDINQQIERLRYHHSKAFQLVSCDFSSSLTRYIGEKERELITIIQLTAPEKISVGELQKKYIEFWDKLAEDSHRLAKTSNLTLRSEWTEFLKKVISARKYLQDLKTSQGYYLPSNFTYDKQFLILDKLEHFLKESYKFRINKVGSTRKIQLQQLQQKLRAAKNEETAAKAIQDTLTQIEDDHKERSLSFNVVILRNPSRTASALRALMQECETEGLIPVIPQPKPCTVELCFAQAIEDYFATDLWMSSRSRRTASRKLLSIIRTINEQVESKKIFDIEGKQKIADEIDSAIAEAERLHKQGEGLTKVLRFFGYKGHSRFVGCLQKTKENLLAKKLIETNYQRVTWPSVKQRLERTIYQYRDGIIASKKQLSANEAQGVKEAIELSVQLLSAENTTHLCHMLSIGISSLNTGFPELAEKLSECYQELRKEGILPPFSATEFSKHMREKIKDQTKEVAELRSKLLKIK